MVYSQVLKRARGLQSSAARTTFSHVSWRMSSARARSDVQRRTKANTAPRCLRTSSGKARRRPAGTDASAPRRASCRPRCRCRLRLCSVHCPLERGACTKRGSTRPAKSGSLPGGLSLDGSRPPRPGLRWEARREQRARAAPLPAGGRCTARTTVAGPLKLSCVGRGPADLREVLEGRPRTLPDP